MAWYLNRFKFGLTIAPYQFLFLENGTNFLLEDGTNIWLE